MLCLCPFFWFFEFAVMMEFLSESNNNIQTRIRQMYIAGSILRNGARLKFNLRWFLLKILPTTNQQPTPLLKRRGHQLSKVAPLQKSIPILTIVLLIVLLTYLRPASESPRKKHERKTCSRNNNSKSVVCIMTR